MGFFLSCPHCHGMAVEPGWHIGQSRVLRPQPWEPHGLASTLDTTQFQRLPSSMGPAVCVPMGLRLSHGHAGPRPALCCPVCECPTLRGSEEMRSEPGPGTQWEPGSAPKSLCCWTNAFPARLCLYQDTNVTSVCLRTFHRMLGKMLQAIPNPASCKKGLTSTLPLLTWFLCSGVRRASQHSSSTHNAIVRRTSIRDP
jgi:hypothetical protein